MEPREALLQIIGHYGPAVIDDAFRFENLLLDYCQPGYQGKDIEGEIHPILRAVQRRLVQHADGRLVVDGYPPSESVPVDAVLSRLSRRLHDAGCDEAGAHRSVEAWTCVVQTWPKRRGEVLLRQGDYEGAVQILTQAIKLNSADSNARRLLAEAHFRRGYTLWRIHRTAEDARRVMHDFNKAKSLDNNCYHPLSNDIHEYYWEGIGCIDERCQELYAATTRAGFRPKIGFSIDPNSKTDAEAELWEQAELAWAFEKVAVVLPKFWETRSVFQRRGWRVVDVGEPAAGLLNLLETRQRRITQRREVSFQYVLTCWKHDVMVNRVAEGEANRLENMLRAGRTPYEGWSECDLWDFITFLRGGKGSGRPKSK